LIGKPEANKELIFPEMHQREGPKQLSSPKG